MSPRSESCVMTVERQLHRASKHNRLSSDEHLHRVTGYIHRLTYTTADKQEINYLMPSFEPSYAERTLETPAAVKRFQMDRTEIQN